MLIVAGFYIYFYSRYKSPHLSCYFDSGISGTSTSSDFTTDYGSWPALSYIYKLFKKGTYVKLLVLFTYDVWKASRLLISKISNTLLTTLPSTKLNGKVKSSRQWRLYDVEHVTASSAFIGGVKYLGWSGAILWIHLMCLLWRKWS